jgi:hypothetical protein
LFPTSSYSCMKTKQKAMTSKVMQAQEAAA